MQDFWRYSNNTPVEQIKMRESLYLFKSGFRPIWEDRRNIQGGSWTFRVPKANGPEFWTRVQLLAIGEKLQEALDQGRFSFLQLPPYHSSIYICDSQGHERKLRTSAALADPVLFLATGDQICGVGLSVRFNSHLISIWHRDGSKQKSIDGMLQCVLENLEPELQPKADNYFYKKHSDHAGFKAPPELQAVLDSQKKREAEAAEAEAAKNNDHVEVTPPSGAA